MKINILIYILALMLWSGCMNKRGNINSESLRVTEDSFHNKVLVKDNNGVEMMIYLDTTKRNIQEIKVYQNNKYIGFYYLDGEILKNSLKNKDYFINHNFKAIIAPYIHEKKFISSDGFSRTIDSLSRNNELIPRFSEYEKKVMFDSYFKKREPIPMPR